MASRQSGNEADFEAKKEWNEIMMILRAPKDGLQEQTPSDVFCKRF